MVKIANDQLIKSILYKNAEKPATSASGPTRNKKSDVAKPYERPSKTPPSKSSDGAWTHDLFRNSLIDRVDSSSTGGPRDLLSGSGGRAGRQARSPTTGGRMASDALLTARPRNSHTGPTTNASKTGIELLDLPARTPSRTLGGPVRPVAVVPPRAGSAQRINRGPRELLSGGGRGGGRGGGGGGGGGSRPSGEPSAMDVEMKDEEPVVVLPTQPVRREMDSLSINRSGGAKKEVVVRIDGLVTGTSESDVQHAFSAMFPIISVALTTAPDPRHPQSHTAPGTISAEVILAARTDAENMVQTCDGRSADGNILAVYIVEPPAPPQPVSTGLKLSERMGFSSAPLSGRIEGAGAMGDGRQAARSSGVTTMARRPENRGNLLNQAMRGATGRDVQVGGQSMDLLETGGIGKMYSDTILQTDPRARVITLEEEQEARAQEAASRGRRDDGRTAGNRQGQQPRGSLANRLTGGRGGTGAGAGAGAGGRGQRGGVQSLASRLS